MVKRTIKTTIQEHIGRGKVIIIYGARRVGKTTLVKEIGAEHGDWVYLSCDEPNVRDGLTEKTSRELRSFVGDVSLVVIDEAQRVPNIGLTLKLLIDTYPDLRVIATGSSSFDLVNKIREPLTGRAFTFHLYPFSFSELAQSYDRPTLDALLSDRIVYGMYPSVVLAKDRNAAEEELRAITSGYLYRDLLAYDGIRKPDLLDKLTRVLATQVGALVSFTELASTLGVSRQTVESYVRILEQAFIIFSLTPFSGNIRSELTKKRKIYFYDTGVRNALLENLNPVDWRPDTGGLWENFVMAERLKRAGNAGRTVAMHFWRTHDGQEIDIVEKESDILHPYEVKWQKPRSQRTPPKWKVAHSDAPVEIIHRGNFLDFLL